MFRIKRLVLTAAGGLALLVSACGGDGAASQSASSDCTPEYSASTQQDGVLRVGAIQYPPYSTIKGGEAGGIDGEIMRGFADAACLEMEAQETTFAAAISSVKTGRVDVAMGDLFRTEERAEEVALSDPVYLDEICIVSNTGVGAIGALEGKTVSVADGTYYVAEVQDAFGDNVKVLPDNVKMYQDLFAGRSDAALDSCASATEYLKSRGAADEYQVKLPPGDPRIPATGEEAAQSAFAYSKANEQLGQALNAYLEDIRASGELAQILTKYGLPASAADVGEPRLS